MSESVKVKIEPSTMRSVEDQSSRRSPNADLGGSTEIMQENEGSKPKAFDYYPSQASAEKKGTGSGSLGDLKEREEFLKWFSAHELFKSFDVYPCSPMGGLQEPAFAARHTMEDVLRKIGAMLRNVGFRTLSINMKRVLTYEREDVIEASHQLYKQLRELCGREPALTHAAPLHYPTMPWEYSPKDEPSLNELRARLYGTARKEQDGERRWRAQESTSRWDEDGDPDYPDDLSDIFEEEIGTRATQSVSTTRIRVATPLEIKEYNGRDRDEERAKSWFNKLKLVFERDQSTATEKCKQFPSMLTGPAKSWYNQLSRPTKENWKTVSELFEIQYCGKGESKSRQYYHMRRSANEDPLDYLFRLNTAAIRAKIRLHNGTAHEQREHVKHYIDTVHDADLAKSLGVLRLSGERDLQEVLQEARRQETRLRSRENKSARESGQAKPKKGFRERPRQVNVLNVNEEEEEEEEDMSDEESEEEEVETDMDRVMKIFAAMKSGSEAEKAAGALVETSCSHCGSKKHQDLGCWKRIMCQVCKRMGHPSDKCFMLCKGCGKAHERGECKLEEFFNNLCKWFNPKEHTGVLPKELEDQLNQTAR